VEAGATKEKYKSLMNENRPSLYRSLGLGVCIGLSAALAIILLAGCERAQVHDPRASGGIADKLIPKSQPVIMAIPAMPKEVSALPASIVLTASTNNAARTPIRGVIEKRGTLRLAWNSSSDPSAAGYRVYFTATNELNWQSADVGNHLKATLSGLDEGAWYRIRVAAYNASQIEGPSSQFIEAETGFYVSIFNNSWSVEAYGASGKTNVMEVSANLATWYPVLEWIGNGSATNLLRSNGGGEMFRVRVK